MVYGFVKQSGGHVKIYSEEGHGTTIRIYLPRVRQEEDLETNIDAGPAKGGTETILAVEDDEEVRTTVVEMLSDLGYRVLKAKDAQSALAIVESGVPIDMLFTDVVMPGPLRSTELARKARERLPAIAVLFTSGYTDNAIVHSGRLDEGIELLSKPYTHEALARKVRYVLQAQNPQAAEIAEAEQHLLEIDPPVMPDSADSFVAQTRLRILLVEDDELIRVSTAELLRTFDFDILEAEGEHDAKQILSEHAISVMLTDVGLAGKSGIDLALDVCRERPDLRVIFLTGYDLVLTPEQRAVLPHAILLRKPYDPLDLIDALKTPLR
jgi:CheY-like chemotaxis protein